MNIQEEQLYERVMERIDLTREMEDEELSEIIYSVLQEFSEEEYLPLKEQIRLSRRLFHSFRKLDVLQELVEDDSITEIMINGKDHIFVERDGRIVRSDKTFLSQEKLEDVIQQIVSGTNRWFTCECCVETSGFEWSDHDDQKVSKRKGDDETVG